MDGENVVHREQAYLIPGDAEVRPVDAYPSIEPDLVISGDGCSGIEEQWSGSVADGQRAGNRSAAGRLDTVQGEDGPASGG
jgi:hypothetical protein